MQEFVIAEKVCKQCLGLNLGNFYLYRVSCGFSPKKGSQAHLKMIRLGYESRERLKKFGFGGGSMLAFEINPLRQKASPCIFG